MLSTDDKLKEKLSVLLPSLNEKQKRLLVGAEAIAFGYGGIKFLSDITGMSTNTITKGIREIGSGDEDVSRIRSKGSGRKRLTIKYPEIEECIEDIIEPDTRLFHLYFPTRPLGLPLCTEVFGRSNKQPRTSAVKCEGLGCFAVF